MAAHGREEAKRERQHVEHQMMERFREYALQQSAQFEQTAQAQRLLLTNAARAEAETSRQQLISAQTQFQSSSSQQNVQISSLESALAHAETRDRAVREDLQGLRVQSENYSMMLGRAEHNWQLLQNETRSSDNLVKVQRAELEAALQELSTNKEVTNELRGQFATLERAQAQATAECSWLTTELHAERRPEVAFPPGADGTETVERLCAFAGRFAEFEVHAEQTLTDVECCWEGCQEKIDSLEESLGVTQTDVQEVVEVVEALQQAENGARAKSPGSVPRPSAGARREPMPPASNAHPSGEGASSGVPPPPKPAAPRPERTSGERGRIPFVEPDANEVASVAAGSDVPMKEIVDAISTSQKEADKIELPNIPEGHQFRNWRIAVREAVASASRNPAAAFIWARKVEENGI